MELELQFSEKPRIRIPENCQTVNSCATPEGKHLQKKFLKKNFELQWKKTPRERIPESPAPETHS